MINTTIKYYGDKTKTFFGRVVNVNDPLELGRVQVRIFGIHSESEDDIKTSDLPWAMCLLPSTEAGVSGIGLSTGIKPFSLVYGYFLDGDNAQEPMVLGSVPNYQRDPELRKLNDKDNPNDFKVSPIPKPTNPDDLLYGTTNTEKAWHWFKSEMGGSYSPPAIAGILGNLYVESYASLNNNDLDPTRKQIDGPGFGLAQWTTYPPPKDDRYKLLIERSGSLPIDSMYAQLKFITYELNKNAGYGKADLLLARTPEQASDVFMIYYERPEHFTAPIPKPVSLGGPGGDWVPNIYPSAKARRKASRNIFNNFSV